MAGVAVRANLLCVTWSAARGHVFLFDLESRRPMSRWVMPACERGWSDAAGVAMDAHFHIFVADPHNGRVRHFSAFGRHLGDLGFASPNVGDAVQDRPGVLDRPHSVALVDDVVLVGCGDRARRRGVQRFARNGSVLRPLASGGDVEATFGAPRGIHVDEAGIWVADTLRGRLQRFRRDGTFVAHVPLERGGVAARPVAVLRLRDGGFLVVDRGDDPGIFALDELGAPTNVARSMACRVTDPVTLAADERGRIYVLDRGGERVVRFGRDLAFDGVVVDLEEHLDDYEPQA